MTTIYERFAVVDVPFPFIETPRRKRRPALVLSDSSMQESNGAVILAMITSAERSAWVHDVPLYDWTAAGLGKSCIVRWKVFTLDSALVAGVRGRLSSRDAQSVTLELGKLFPLPDGSGLK